MFIALSQQRRDTLLKMLAPVEAAAATHVAPQPPDAAAHASAPLREATQYREVHQGDLAMLTELFFITPAARESYVFVVSMGWGGVMPSSLLWRCTCQPSLEYAPPCIILMISLLGLPACTSVVMYSTPFLCQNAPQQIQHELLHEGGIVACCML